MADALSDQLAAGPSLGTASAGLGGASGLIAETEDGAPFRVKRFTFTIPASGAGSAQGDRVLLCKLNVFARIYAIKGFFPAMGSGVTVSFGKVDLNNSANTDNVHYLNALAVAAPAVAEGDTNMTEQVGTAPTGDTTTTGQGPTPSVPGGGYGNDEGIVITATLGGGTPTAAAKFYGYVQYANQ